MEALGEVHVDPAERIDHAGEGVEVEFDEVLDRDAEVLLDRGDQLGGPLGESGIDLVGPALAGIGNEGVARDGQDRDTLCCGVEVENHHHIGVHAGDTL